MQRRRDVAAHAPRHQSPVKMSLSREVHIPLSSPRGRSSPAPADPPPTPQRALPRRGFRGPCAPPAPRACLLRSERARDHPRPAPRQSVPGSPPLVSSGGPVPATSTLPLHPLVRGVATEKNEESTPSACTDAQWPTPRRCHDSSCDIHRPSAGDWLSALPAPVLHIPLFVPQNRLRLPGNTVMTTHPTQECMSCPVHDQRPAIPR